MGFMIIIMFIWLVIMTVVVIHLNKKFQQFKQTELHDVVELFETYLEDIKAENQRLQEQLSLSTSKPTQSQKNNHQPADERAFVTIGDKLNDKVNIDQVDISREVQQDDVKLSTSFEASVLQLYQQGFSEEDIARKLNSGKTEVALIINLYGERQQNS